MSRSDRVFEGLVFTGISLMDHGDRMKRLLAQGKEIPDYLLPGRAIMRMSPERREALSLLTAEDTNHRPDWIKLWV